MLPRTPKILIIDDDRSTLLTVQAALEPMHAEVFMAQSIAEGERLAESIRPDVVLLDVVFPQGSSGLEAARRLRAIDQRMPLIVMTGSAGSDTAIEAMQAGAFDYVSKPVAVLALQELVAKAVQTRRLMSVPVALGIDDRAAPTGDQFVGRSPQMLEVFKAIGRVADQNVPVLIRGESGTGKELVARALFQFGSRSQATFMAVNCAALPDTLLESELFGHEKGAFTGADRRRIGKFEQCDGGTLFLDEIGDMSPLVQGKVLRIIQEQRFDRVGGNETVSADVRLISATNRPLEQMVEKNEFREDLLYRLNAVTIHLPPLRHRKDDIPLLLKHFLVRARVEMNRPDLEGVSPEALVLFQEYQWPGNVRELESMVRRCVLQTTGPVIVPEFLPPELLQIDTRIVSDHVESSSHHVATSDSDSAAEAPASTVAHTSATESDPPDGMELKEFIESRISEGSSNLYAEAVERMERQLFKLVLQATGGNQSRAAELLGITRGKVRDRIAAFNITLDRTVAFDSDPQKT